MTYHYIHMCRDEHGADPAQSKCWKIAKTIRAGAGLVNQQPPRRKTYTSENIGPQPGEFDRPNQQRTVPTRCAECDCDNPPEGCNWIARSAQ